MQGTMGILLCVTLIEMRYNRNIEKTMNMTSSVTLNSHCEWSWAHLLSTAMEQGTVLQMPFGPKHKSTCLNGTTTYIKYSDERKKEQVNLFCPFLVWLEILTKLKLFWHTSLV